MARPPAAVVNATIRHDGPRVSILAYVEKPASAARIIAYMWLIHRTHPRAAQGALYRLFKAGALERVARGRYRKTG